MHSKHLKKKKKERNQNKKLISGKHNTRDKHYAEHKRCLAVCESGKLNFTAYSLPDVKIAHPCYCL